VSKRSNPTPAENRRQIVELIKRNHVVLWLEGDRLLARWTREATMPEGADGFIRRFKPEIVAHLRDRMEQEMRAA
jgi:hypothetical protein